MAAPRRRIVVDLIPLLPGGANGGAKPYAMSLIPQLAAAAPDTEFVLLTASTSHAELASLESSNVRRVCVVRSGAAPARRAVGPVVRLRARARRLLAQALPLRAVHWAESIYFTLRNRPRQSNLLVQLGADLLFCPFTAPFFQRQGIPLVAFIHDLQYLHYPQFFSAEQQHYRARDFNNACRSADRVVCMSDFVRRSILETGRVSPERVVMIRARATPRLHIATSRSKKDTLAQLNLQADTFLLYPANGWPNKNHPMLLTAFGMFRARHPESPLQLVCTGVSGGDGERLRRAVERMGLSDFIRLPGYVGEHQLATLFDSCRAVIFPSLYEGFGLPLVEAMEFGKPLLCSNVTSIPEVAGDAARYFDPRRPDEIVAAIELAATTSAELAQLIEAGRRRLTELPQPSEATVAYLQVFDELIGRHSA